VDFLVIEGLKAVVEYEVSVRAVNEIDESAVALIGNTTKEIFYNYQLYINLFFEVWMHINEW
jgi:hypothetical protein